MNSTLYYIHDPMCSWCWGYRPVWEALQLTLPETIDVRYVVGGLAPDSNSPMPIEQQNMIEAHWHTIEQKLGTPFNYDFWRHNTPRRSTYNACRAVIAASNQGYEKEMIEAIQRAYYLQALNPSDDEVLIDLAKALAKQRLTSQLSSEQLPSEQLPSEQLYTEQTMSDKNILNLSRFVAEFTSQVTQQTLIQEIQFARELTTQGFPSLVLECHEMRHSIAINYQDAQVTLSQVLALLDKH